MEEVNSTEVDQAIKEQFIPKPLPFVEKNGFPHWLVALIWIFVALISFNIIGALVSGFAALLLVDDLSDPQAVLTALTENVDILFIGNSTGQILVMALGTLLIVRLSALKGQRRKFLRMQTSKNVWVVSVLAVVLTVAVFPTVTFLGWLNSFFPAPQALLEMQDSMMEMITKFLSSDNVLLLGLFHIGVVPAICEEIMYRGYIQRSLEKSAGIWAAIIISGFIFGAYHLQINNILPLAFLGIILAYVTYISDSIIPAILAHFANNGGQVIATSFYPDMLEQTITPETEMPWRLIIISIIVSSALIYLLYRLKLNPEE